MFVGHVRGCWFLCLQMSLFTASLNSGSNGNCYYVGNGTEAVLVDAGLSCRETECRMARLGLSMKAVKAIFISHEHGDHIKGVNVLSKKYNLPVYFTKNTFRFSRLSVQKSLVRIFRGGEPVAVGNLGITAFAKHHDARDPHSFIVEGNDTIIGVFTDIGNVCDNLTSHFKQCHAAFLEANYDADMLEKGRYPIHLKQRIRGGKGHLSNDEALALFKQHRPAHMSHIFLAHMSKDNNDPELAAELFNRHANGTEVVIASRYNETGVYHIQAQAGTQTNTTAPALGRQASLF